MNEKIKIIHDALKALKFDVVYNNDNDILETLFTTCGRMEYMIEVAPYVGAWIETYYVHDIF